MNTRKIWILFCAAGALGLCAQPLTAQQTQAAQAAQPAQSAASETTSSAAQAAAPENGKTYDITVEGTSQWTDTKIDLRAGEKLQITGSGTVTYPANPSSKSKSTEPQTFGPEGLARGWQDLIHEYAVTSAGHGALVGRLGAADTAQPFLVGTSLEYTAPVAGRLFLGINQSLKDAGSASGSFAVKIEVLDPGASTADAASVGGPAETRIAGITPELLGKLPRRVNDAQGNPGDMVNILIVGTEDQMVNAFTTAGWVHVDSSVQGTVVNALMDSFEKKDYLTMPMSTLMLFGRPQDYGFAHAEPVRVAMTRNHLRVWKSPYTVEGRALWCVAATHDIGFERDQRNNGVTHKIDPAIDGEREYVNATLSGTGLVAGRDHVTPENAVKEAKTATGGSWNSDGRVLVLVLKDTAAAKE